ncbi:MAG: DUF305 domain-containing protein [Brevinema sp.]
MKIQLLLLLVTSTLSAQNMHHDHAAMMEGNKILGMMHEDMMNSKFEEGANLELNFIQNMIPHHIGAIKSAKALLPQTKNAELLTLLSNIISSQEKEVKEFTELVKKLKAQTPAHTQEQINTYNTASKKNMEKMMKDMMAAPKDTSEKAFLHGMVAHHTAAVVDAKLILNVTKNPEVKKIAEDIVNAQESEITLMKRLITEIK